MNCYILTKNKKVLHEIEAVDLMQISTIHKFAKAVLQSNAMEYGLGADFAISSSEYAKEQIYEKYLNDFLVEKQKEDANFAQQLRMPVHKFRKLLMHFSQQLYNKSYGIKELKAENLGTFEEWPFFNDVIMKVMIPAEKEYEEQIFSKNKIDLKESMLLLNDAVNGAFKEKCGLKYKYLFIDEFQDTDDVQIDSFLKLQNVIKDTKLFVVGDLKQSIYRFRGATISAFDLIRTDKEKWEEFKKDYVKYGFSFAVFPDEFYTKPIDRFLVILISRKTREIKLITPYGESPFMEVQGNYFEDLITNNFVEYKKGIFD